LLIGVFYLPTLMRREGASIEYVQSAWAILSAGTALTIYFAWNTGFLLGAGKVSSAYWAQIASRAGFVVTGGLALIGGWGLLGLAIGNLIAVLAARIILQWRMAPLLRELQGVHAVPAPKAEALFSALWPNAARMGLVALGAFLITRLNVLVASSFFSLETAASYAITLQLLMAVNSVAQLPISVALPQMVRLRVQQQTKTLRSIWMVRQTALLVLFVIGAICVAFVAQPLLELVGSNVALLPIPLMLLMGLVLLLEANHASCALVITTDNNVPFVGSALFSGLAVAVLSIGATWAGWGIGGLILAQGLVQLAYNNWKWPLALWRELDQ
jgi:O-antigen/teichoic acid export membrane protein